MVIHQKKGQYKSNEIQNRVTGKARSELAQLKRMTRLHKEEPKDFLYSVNKEVNRK